MERKYEMFGVTNDQGLRRIRAVRSFGDIRVGDIGGWIESEKNLSYDGNARVSGDAQVIGDDDFCAFDKFGSENRVTTAFKDSKIGIRVVCGCFTGSLKEFRDKITKTHGNSNHGKLYRMMADMIELKLTTKRK